MSKKELYPRLTEMPYYNTKVDKETTKAEINKLLKKYGIEDKQWTELQGKDSLKFLVETIVQGVQVKKAVRFDIPILKAIFGGKHNLIDVPINHVYRIFYYSLKSLLESTKYGIVKIDELLFSYVVTQLPSGEEVLIKDLLKEHPLLLTNSKEM